MLSKIILDYLTKNMTSQELLEFTNKILIPQNAINLIRHFNVAREIIEQKSKTKK